MDQCLNVGKWLDREARTGLKGPLASLSSSRGNADKSRDGSGRGYSTLLAPAVPPAFS
jgi:hypothetical protein